MKLLCRAELQTVPAGPPAPSEGLSGLSPLWSSRPVHSLPGKVNQSREFTAQTVAWMVRKAMFKDVWLVEIPVILKSAFGFSVYHFPPVVLLSPGKNGCEGMYKYDINFFTTMTSAVIHAMHFFTLLRSSDTPPSFSGASLGLLVSWFFWEQSKHFITETMTGRLLYLQTARLPACNKWW